MRRLRPWFVLGVSVAVDEGRTLTQQRLPLVGVQQLSANTADALLQHQAGLSVTPVQMELPASIAEQQLMRSEAANALDDPGVQQSASLEANYPQQSFAVRPASAPASQQYTSAGPAYSPAPGRAGYGVQSQRQASSSRPSPIAALMGGACLVPMRSKGKSDYLCAEGETSELSIVIADQEEKLVEDGGTCTVVCNAWTWDKGGASRKDMDPHAYCSSPCRWWQEPSPGTMKCAEHVWDTEAYVVQCAASKRYMLGAFLMVVLLGAFVYHRQQQQHLEQIQVPHKGFARQNAQTAPPPLQTDAATAHEHASSPPAEAADSRPEQKLAQ